MNLVEKKVKTFNIISIEGRLDATNYLEFQKRILEIIDRGEIHLIFGCAGLDYISSSGLRAFLALLKKVMTQNGKLYICELQPHIKDIFDISGFSGVIQIFETEKEVLDSIPG